MNDCGRTVHSQRYSGLRRSNLGIHFVLVILSVVMLIPLAWCISTAFRTPLDLFRSPSVSLIPKHFTLANFSEAWGRAPFGKYLYNTIVFTFGLLMIQLVTLTLAAYAFARLKFKGRDLLFYVFLAQMMIAPQSLIVPNYLTIRKLGLLDTKLAIMMPYFASAFGTFLLRQAFKTIPVELEESAKLDGCDGLRFLWYIGVPLVKPTLFAFSIISLVYHWSEFFWPLVVTNTPRSRVLTIGLAMFGRQAESGSEWTLLMATTLAIILPPLVSFLIFQRHFINSFMKSGIKT